MLWPRLKSFIPTVAVLLIGTFALWLSFEPFVAKLQTAHLGGVNNAAMLYGLIALTYAPFLIAFILFGFALSYALSLYSRVCTALFLGLSAVLLAAGVIKYVPPGPYSLVGMATLNQRTYSLIRASGDQDEWSTLLLCECQISNLACKCRRFYAYRLPTAGTDFSLRPDWEADAMRVWLNGKLLYEDGFSPRCYAQKPLIDDACIED